MFTPLAPPTTPLAPTSAGPTPGFKPLGSAPAPTAPTPSPYANAASTAGQILAPVAKAVLPIASTIATALPKAPGQIADQFKSGINNIEEGYTRARDAGTKSANPVGDLFSGSMKMLSGAASAVTSPLAPALAPVSAAVNTIANAPIAPGLPAISDLKPVQKFALSPAGERTSAVADFAGDTANVLGTVAGAESLPAQFKNLTATTPEALKSNTVTQYTKAVKPTIVGKSTLGATDAYNGKVVSAVDTIAKNKPNLKYTTEDGAVETGRTPQSLGEFSQAIDQTKKTIYGQYSSLAKQAGETGITVDPKGVAADLQPVIDSKALQLSHPEAVSYAKQVSDRYANADPLDPEVTQSIIENYNNELQSFYRNPSYNQASRVAIDAAVVRHFRTALDDAITKSTGTQYQALRTQYGALKTIEADVNKAANRVARLNNKGLADYTDIFSGGDIVHGIISMNPALFAKGVAQGLIKGWYKSLNSPDGAIKGMFNKVDGQPSSAASNSSKATLPMNTPSATAAAVDKKASIPQSLPPTQKPATKLPPAK